MVNDLSAAEGKCERVIIIWVHESRFGRPVGMDGCGETSMRERTSSNHACMCGTVRKVFVVRCCRGKVYPTFQYSARAVLRMFKQVIVESWLGEGLIRRLRKLVDVIGFEGCDIKSLVTRVYAVQPHGKRASPARPTRSAQASFAFCPALVTTATTTTACYYSARTHQPLALGLSRPCPSW